MKQKPAASRKSSPPILAIVVLVLIGGIVYLGYKSLVANPRYTLQKQATSPRSKTPGVIDRLVAAKGIDPKTGEAVGVSTTFSKTDPSLYVVMTLKNPKVGTKFEFVRYLNGKFLDNGSLTMKKATTNNVSFNWDLKKPGAIHLVGNYRVKVYTNGVFEKEVTYKVL